MECKDCRYKAIDGSCKHPKALEIWAEYNGKKCPMEEEQEFYEHDPEDKPSHPSKKEMSKYLRK